MEHAIVLAPEVLGYLGPLPVTNTLLVSWIVMLFLIVISVITTWKIKAIPAGLQNFFEFVIETGYNTVEELAHSKAKLFFPIVMTFFLFIVTANWFGLFPGFTTVGFFRTEVEQKELEEKDTITPFFQFIKSVGASEKSEQKTLEEGAILDEKEKPEDKTVFIPLLRSINSDLNMTLSLALVSAFLTHAFALKFLGVLDYLKKWFSLNPVFLFVGLLELVSEFTKIVSLSFRLFGNIFAGEVVLVTVSGIFAFLVPLPFMFLEIIVGFVQAAVFMMLTLVFMVLLSEKHGEEH